MRRLGMAVLAAALAGCVTATSFEGPAKVKDGPAGCKAACEGWGMELAGMVKMGEYSDGCICQVKARPPAPSQPPASGAPAAGPPSAATIPAAAGVHMQMVAAAAAAAAQQRAMAESQQRTGTSPSAPEYPYVPHSPVGSPGWRPGLP